MDENWWSPSSLQKKEKEIRKIKKKLMMQMKIMIWYTSKITGCKRYKEGEGRAQ